MAEKLNRHTIRKFILITKVIPILIAIVHCINYFLSFLGSNDIPLNYIGGISLLPIIYLYVASYTFKLCSYYRMFLHYSILIDALNIYDFYIGIPLDDTNYFILFVCITIVTMLITIYLKFFKS